MSGGIERFLENRHLSRAADEGDFSGSECVTLAAANRGFSHLRHESPTSPSHRLDEAWIGRIISEETTGDIDHLVDCPLLYGNARPARVEKLLAGDEAVIVPRKVQQHVDDALVSRQALFTTTQLEQLVIQLELEKSKDHGTLT